MFKVCPLELIDSEIALLGLHKQRMKLFLKNINTAVLNVHCLHFVQKLDDCHKKCFKRRRDLMHYEHFKFIAGCVDLICSSDHKPVFSSFDVAVINQFTSSKGGNALSGDVKIAFEEISAEVFIP